MFKNVEDKARKERKLLMFYVYMRTNEYEQRERYRQWTKKNKAITCDSPLNSSVHLYHDVSLKKEKFEIGSR